eukprot:9662158-Alexandrium_andersonii.AAC.1
MSASLVGSEMCIRDSCAPPHPRSTRVDTRISTAQVALPSSGPSAAADAVSYTHLTLPTICSV